jgi:hypothetical protein
MIFRIVKSKADLLLLNAFFQLLIGFVYNSEYDFKWLPISFGLSLVMKSGSSEGMKITGYTVFLFISCDKTYI